MTIKRYDILAAILIIVSIVAFSHTCYRKYQTFSYYDYDLAVANQIMWNNIHGDFFDTSLQGGNFLKLHAPLIYLLFIPFYALWPSPLTLLYAKVILLILVGWPIYLLAKSELKNEPIALVFLAAYLLYPAVGYISLGHPHGITYAPFFLAWAYYFYRKDNYAPFAIMIALAVATREEISFMAVAFGIYALWERKDFKWWAEPLLLGIGWFALYFFFLGPYLRSSEKSPFLAYYWEVGGTVPELFNNIFTHPLLVLRVVFGLHKITYIFRLMAPLAFMPIFSPGVLFLCLPNLLLNMLSSRMDIADIYMQYTSPLIPYIFFAGIMGFAKISQLIKSALLKNFIIRLILIMTIIFSWRMGPQLHLFSREWQGLIGCLPRDNFLNAMRWKMVTMVPPGVPAATDFRFVTYLSNRKVLEGLYIVLHGFFNVKKPHRTDIEWALFDFGDPTTFVKFYDPKTTGKDFRRYLFENHLGLVQIYDQIALYRRGAPDAVTLWERLAPEKRGDRGGKALATFDGLLLKGVELEPVGTAPMRQIRFTSLWEATGRDREDVSLVVRVEGTEGGELLRQVTNICYHLYPTSEWREGELIRANHFIAVPPALPAGGYSLQMIVINKFPPCRVQRFSSLPGSVAREGWFVLGNCQL